MAVTTVYNFFSLGEIDEGPITSGADAASVVNGRFVVAGIVGGQIALRMFRANETVQGDTVAISGGDTAVSALSNGNYAVAIDGGNQLFFAVFGSDGSVVVAPTAADNVFSQLLDVEIAGRIGGGRFAVAAQSFISGTNNDIRISIRNNDGSLVNTFAVDATGANDQNPTIAALNDGGFAVAWHRNIGSDNELWWAVYEADGTVRKAAALLDTTGTVNRNASAAALQDGGFAVVYEDNGWNGDVDISLARFNAAGAFLGVDDISQNAFVDSTPSVTVLTNGMIAVGYVRADGDTDPVWALVDQSTGALLGESRTGEVAAVNDFAPTVAATQLGRMVTFFTSGGDVYGQTLQGRRFQTSDAAGDTMVGDELRDLIAGNDGNDIITGGANYDALLGGAGADTFNFNTDDAPSGEVIDGGTGDDVIIVRSSVDLTGATISAIEQIEFSAADTLDKTVNLSAGQLGGLGPLLIDGNAQDTVDTLDVFMGSTLSVSLANLSFTDWDSAGTELDRILIFGDSDSEAIIGSSQRDDIDGGNGNDSFDGGLGNDVLLGGPGNDFIDGGGGTADVADYREKTTAVAVTLNGAISASVTVGGVAEDLVRNVEHIYGGSGSDVLSGDALGNLLNGFFGNDILRGGAGKDALFGSAGIDMADYRDKAAAVVVTLNGGGQANVTVGGLQEDVISNIEILYGGSVADTFTGDGFANLFRGGGGADLINGGAGQDAIDFRDKAAAVVLTLNGAVVVTATIGGAAEDQFRNIEDVLGGTANDILVGDGLANQLFGNGGNDTLRGGLGIDTLTGGAGADLFVYNTVAESTAVARDKILDFATGVDKIKLTLMDANTTVAGDQAFIFGGAFTAGHLRVSTLSPGVLLVEGNTDADADAEFSLAVTATTLVATDFQL